MKYVYIYVNTIKIRFMKSILAFSMMAILLLLFTVFGHTSSFQMVYAQTNSITAALSDFNFAAAGDWGCKDETTETVNNIVDKTPEVVLGLGDFSYSDDANCWLEIIEPIDDNMKIAIGNEDLQGSELTQLMEHFGLTSQYYSFDYQNVHFTVMADYLPYETDSEQYDFVNDDLAKAATDPNIDWIIIVHHSQKYASTQNYDIPEEKEWNNIYHPLLEQYNVDLVLQGHQHNYQRTYPIKYNSDSPANPIVTDKSTNNYTNPEGQIYLTVGTGGAGLHGLNGNKAPYLITTEDQEHGFLNIDVTGSNNNSGTTMLVGTFYSNDGSGEMTDEFTITKSVESDLSLPSRPDLPVEEEVDIGGEQDDSTDTSSTDDDGDSSDSSNSDTGDSGDSFDSSGDSGEGDGGE
jgi:predicted phosphodiesterase